MAIKFLFASVVCATQVPNTASISADAFSVVGYDELRYEDVAHTAESFLDFDSVATTEQTCEQNNICDVTKKKCGISCERFINGCRAGSFIEKDWLATSSPSNSPEVAREMARSLKRDPQEELKYNAQMLSALGDKQRMIDPLYSESLGKEPIVIVDIGPAGGAIPKALAQISMNRANMTKKSCFRVKQSADVHYYGVELNPDQVIEMRNFLSDRSRNDNTVANEAGTCTPSEALALAQVKEGNALELSVVMEEIMIETESILVADTVAAMKDKVGSVKLLIVESSVLHEIYSYAPCDSLVCSKRLADMVTPEIRAGFAVAPLVIDGVHRYRPEIVLKNYEEAIRALSDGGGGMLAVRDGVLYKKPNELVQFRLLSAEWEKMFKLFIFDKKYRETAKKHLPNAFAQKKTQAKKTLKDIVLQVKGQTLQLPAKLVQEFMLKANWGLEGWQNEIHEVYGYATLRTHKAIVEKMADIHNVKIEFKAAEEYVQCDYPKNTEKHIQIVSGFGCAKGERSCCAYPPTNMLLKVAVASSRSLAREL